MIFENEKSFAELTEFSSVNKIVGASASMIEKSSVKEGFILETLLVKDPKDFGKGYGKELFINILSEINKPILIYPFGIPYFSENGEDSTYSGRVKWDSMEDMEKGKEELVNKFYLPLIKKSGRKFSVKETENNIMITVF